MRGVVSGYIGQVFKAEFVGQYFLLSFSVAESVYLGAQKGKETCWHKCELWGKSAEALSKYLVKGLFVAVSGQSYLQTYTGNDGMEKTSLVVKANDVTMGPNNTPNFNKATPSAPSHDPAARSPEPQPIGFGDEIPF